MMPRTVGTDSSENLTKREKFALEAMKSIEVGNVATEYAEVILSPREVANRAVAMADKLIERLNSEGPLEKPEPTKKPGIFG